MLLEEMARLDSRRNVVTELAALFWIPKSLLTLQLQQAIRHETAASTVTSTAGRSMEIAS
jgi:hypothetical protein